MKGILFHVDEMEKWELTLQNVRNIISFYQKRNVFVTVEIVANSAAVTVLQDAGNEMLYTLSALAQEGVMISACNNALHAFGIAHEKVPDYITVVPAGVAEIAEKQWEGYAYLKP